MLNLVGTSLNCFRAALAICNLDPVWGRTSATTFKVNNDVVARARYGRLEPIFVTQVEFCLFYRVTHWIHLTVGGAV